MKWRQNLQTKQFVSRITKTLGRIRYLKKLHRTRNQDAIRLAGGRSEHVTCERYRSAVLIEFFAAPNHGPCLYQRRDVPIIVIPLRRYELLQIFELFPATEVSLSGFPCSRTTYRCKSYKTIETWWWNYKLFSKLLSQIKNFTEKKQTYYCWMGKSQNSRHWKIFKYRI